MSLADIAGSDMLLRVAGCWLALPLDFILYLGIKQGSTYSILYQKLNDSFQISMRYERSFLKEGTKVKKTFKTVTEVYQGKQEIEDGSLLFLLNRKRREMCFFNDYNYYTINKYCPKKFFKLAHKIRGIDF